MIQHMTSYAYRISTFVIIALIVISDGRAALGTQPNQDEIMQKIADPNTNENDIAGLIEKVRDMKPSLGERVIWAQIANSDKFSPIRRQQAVLQLFDRYTSLGMTLQDLSGILDHPSWIQRENIYKITAITGKPGPDPPPRTIPMFKLDFPVLGAGGA